MNPPALPAGPLLDDATHLMARLQRHPRLHEQVAALLDEVENRAGALNTGDEAEDAIVRAGCSGRSPTLAGMSLKIPFSARSALKAA